jgi:trimethylamine--corrinoid protein Co-methyltransferase
MKTSRFEVLSAEEVSQIHAASMDILQSIGVKVDYPPAQRLFQAAGATCDEKTQAVRIPASLVQWAVEQAPKRFQLYGLDGSFHMEIGNSGTNFAALGTPTAILDLETGQHRPTTMADVIRHIQLIDGCAHIHNSQMDVWPNDIPMTTIHTESIYAWAHNSRKPFGMGCYGYLPTLDMMQMMAIAVGGKEELRQRPRFFAICSTVSPLQMTQMQLEGLLICAEYGQPLAMSPEGIAGATAPATLAGLLVQENANILAHITLAQIYRPGTPVLYGTVSTIANMRLGTVALGSVETGLITAGAAQMARFYGLPCRSVGAVTESKLEDYQAGFERTATLLPAVLAGVDFITCAGTLDSSMLESDALLVLDDEICGALLRMARGVEVNATTMAMDAIRKVGFTGNFLTERHTVENYRKEHFIPRLLPREPYETWVKAGSKTALESAREKAHQILAAHRPIDLDPGIEAQLQDFRQQVSERPIEAFYQHESIEYQDLLNKELTTSGAQ